MLMLPHVLFLGIDHARSKGGVPEVERFYCRMLGGAKFVATAVDGSKAHKLMACVRGFASLLWVLARDRHIRIVHVHGCGGNSVWRKGLFIVVACMAGKKVVYHVHSGRFVDTAMRHPRAVRGIVGMCDAIIALSPRWKDSLGRMFPSARIEVVPNGVFPSEHSIGSRSDCGELVVAYLGMIRRDKGVYDLLDAMARIKASGAYRVRLKIAGVGEHEKLDREIMARGIADVVEQVGWVDGLAKARLLADADVLALPSYSEGLPVSVLEAMAVGLPVVAARVGGIPDLLGDDGGFLVEPGDVDAISDAICALAADASLRESMGRRNQREAAWYYPDKIKSRLCSVYESL